VVFLPDGPIRAVLISLLVGKFATGYATATAIKIVRVIILRVTLPHVVECQRDYIIEIIIVCHAFQQTAPGVELDRIRFITFETWGSDKVRIILRRRHNPKNPSVNAPWRDCPAQWGSWVWKTILPPLIFCGQRDMGALAASTCRIIGRPRLASPPWITILITICVTIQSMTFITILITIQSMISIAIHSTIQSMISIAIKNAIGWRG
jgi:hypothetical protein